MADGLRIYHHSARPEVPAARISVNLYEVHYVWSKFILVLLFSYWCAV
jgi:hypothetical protein